MECGARTLTGSRTIRASKAAAEAGIVQLRSCTAYDGVSWGQITRAYQPRTDFMTENDLPDGTYYWSAGPGAAKDPKIDFYAIWITESLQQRQGTGCDRGSTRD